MTVARARPPGTTRSSRWPATSPPATTSRQAPSSTCCLEPRHRQPGRRRLRLRPRPDLGHRPLPRRGRESVAQDRRHPGRAHPAPQRQGQLLGHGRARSRGPCSEIYFDGSAGAVQRSSRGYCTVSPGRTTASSGCCAQNLARSGLLRAKPCRACGAVTSGASRTLTAPSLASSRLLRVIVWPSGPLRSKPSPPHRLDPEPPRRRRARP